MPMNIVTSDSSDIPASPPSINDLAVALSSASGLDTVQEEQPENQAGRPSRMHRLPLRFRDERPVCHIPYINASHPDFRNIDPVRSDVQIRF
jgi:hypothetical protein